MIHAPELKLVSVAAVIIGFSSLFVYAASSSQASANEVSGKYIVVLKDTMTNSDQTINDLEKKHGVSSEMRYAHVIKGFSTNLSGTKLTKMKSDPRVQFVSEDRIVSIDGRPSSAGAGAQPAVPAQSQSEERVEVKSKPAKEESQPKQPEQGLPTAPLVDENSAEASGRPPKKGVNQPVQPTQPGQIIPTGINRIGAVNLANKGTGVGVAVIDTGIDLTHPDLVANISRISKTCVPRTTSAQDDNGHGTHVAGTIAAANNTIGVVGVAPEATLYAVKVLDKDGWGTWSSIICGIDWVTANAQSLNIKVANMSLGGIGTSDNNCGLTNSDALHAAICNSTRQGVTYVVAAGNNGMDATQSVPASYDDAVITVSALADNDGVVGGVGGATQYGVDDTFASFSNYGSPVDIGAPGVNIMSTWKGGTYNAINGTSMATPHIAGASALLMRGNPGATWMQVRDALRFIGETINAGHTDPSNLHGEPIVKASSL